MIREIVTIKDYHRLSQTYEHYLWHFVRKDHCDTTLVIKPLLLMNCDVEVNPLEVLMEYSNIPYFESYIDDSFDFLYSNGIPIQNLWDRYNKFNPIILGMKKSIFYTSTFQTCYCQEGITEVILNLDEKYMLNID